MKRMLLLVCILCSTLKMNATTWFDGKVVDPISKEEVKVKQIGSYGSYIYRWPSKYDGIYWPMTDARYIYFNPKTGYIAYAADFEKISEEELKNVKKFLSEKYDSSKPPTTFVDKILWLEQVYSHRKTNKTLSIRNYCLLSYTCRNDKKESTKYRKIALNKIEAYLKTAKPSFERSQFYVVAGFYAKLLGDEKKAKKLWESQERTKLDDKANKKALEYLDEVLTEIKNDSYKNHYAKDQN